MANKIVGLDIGATMIRAAEVESSGRAQGGAPLGSLLKYAEAQMPPGAYVDGEVHDTATVAGALKRLWSQGGFSTKDVIVGIGNARTVVREMQVAELPMADLRKSLPFQVEEFLPTSTDESLLDFYPTAEIPGERGPMLRGILVAASKYAVGKTAMAVESAGLKLKGVDLKAFALTRALVPGQWDQATVALVDIGARTTTVVIVEAGMPRLIRMLPAGGGDVTDAIASAAHVAQNEAEEFKHRFGMAGSQESGSPVATDAMATVAKNHIDSIRNTLLYYTGNNAGAVIQHVVLTGAASLMPGFGQVLASACRLPVSFGNGAAAVKMTKRAQQTAQGREALIAVASGLGLGEVAS